MARLILGAAGVIALMCANELPSQAAGSNPEQYNVVWHSPSENASGSMPAGNGEVGINAWVERGGDLLFYISRTDAWSESCRLLKLGRVRVHVTPNPFKAGSSFRQELKLQDGAIQIDAADAHLKVFVDADAPVVFVTGTFSQPRSVTATFETWRTARKSLKGEELGSSWTMQGAPVSFDVWEAADVLRAGHGNSDSVVCYHRNGWSCVPLTLKHQGLESAASAVHDPLVNRTTGSCMTGLPLKAAGKGSLASDGPIQHFELAISTLSAQTTTPEAWETRLAKPVYADAAAARTAAWWKRFWQRSFIHVSGTLAQMPESNLSLRIGKDSGGGSQFRGEISGAKAFGRDLSEEEIKELAQSPHSEPNHVEDIPLDRGFTVAAWIKPAAGESGRIFDKITPGGADGFLFDTHPGLALRFIVGNQTMTANSALQAGEWQHVAAVADNRGGRRIYLNGKIVQATSGLSIGQAYALQRWMTAICGRGAYPIKFNGSIFTVDPEYAGGPKLNADWRRWGDCYWWQNTRLPYFPMIARGDFEELQPIFRMYRDALKLCEARSAIYHNVKGAYFPETMTIFGTYANSDYGWNREGLQPKDVQSPWWQYAWQQGLELTALMLDYYEYTQDEAFLKRELIPMANAVLQYYDTRFKRSGSGELIISPTQAVETYWYDVVNDTPSTAGLHDVLNRLLRLSHQAPENVAFWQKMLKAAPPVAVKDGVVQPAGSFKPQRTNVENPELYAIWPFRIFGVGRPDLQTGMATFLRRPERASIGWQYDGQCAAIVGLGEEAGKILTGKVANTNGVFRFPVMWGPNYDWLPDQDHGSNIMLTLQTMVLQADGSKIFLLPAWPKAWDVSFKLHAPMRTTVECEYRGGKIFKLVVIPESRRHDIVLPENLLEPADKQTIHSIPGNTWEKPESCDDERHRSIVAAIHQQAPDLLMIGDSITQNYEKRSPPQEDFAPIWDQYYKPINAVNMGFSGQTTSHLLWHLQNGFLDGIAPRAAVILLGTNNTSFGANAEQTAAGLKAVIDLIHSRLPLTRIVLVGILPSDIRNWPVPAGKDPAKKAAYDLEVNKRLKSNYEDSKFVTYLDVSSVLLKADGTLDEELYYDPHIVDFGPNPAGGRIMGGPLHPNTAGQRKMAELIAPTLSRLLTSH